MGRFENMAKNTPDLNLPRELSATLLARASSGSTTVDAVLRVREEW